MDYDGAGQHEITHLGSISLSPRVSPDGTHIAFSSFDKSGLQLKMYSLDLGRLLVFPAHGGSNMSPAWSADGTKLAFSSSMQGSPNIYIADSSGLNARRLTQD